MIASHSSHRILLVEDESVIREYSTQVLTRAGYDVDAVEEGQSGWEALQARTYDLLITDNRMAGISGAELIVKLRTAQMTLPVILASGGIDPEYVAEGSSFQPVTALPKPFTSTQLLAMVAEILQPARRTTDGPGSYTRRSEGAYPHWGLNE